LENATGDVLLAQVHRLTAERNKAVTALQVILSMVNTGADSGEVKTLATRTLFDLDALPPEGQPLVIFTDSDGTCRAEYVSSPRQAAQIVLAEMLDAADALGIEYDDLPALADIKRELAVGNLSVTVSSRQGAVLLTARYKH